MTGPHQEIASLTARILNDGDILHFFLFAIKVLVGRFVNPTKVFTFDPNICRIWMQLLEIGTKRQGLLVYSILKIVCNWTGYFVNWRINKLPLLHNLYSSAKHFLLFAQRLFLVLTQTQYHCPPWGTLLIDCSNPSLAQCRLGTVWGHNHYFHWKFSPFPGFEPGTSPAPSRYATNWAILAWIPWCLVGILLIL